MEYKLLLLQLFIDLEVNPPSKIKTFQAKSKCRVTNFVTFLLHILLLQLLLSVYSACNSVIFCSCVVIYFTFILH